MDGNNNVRRVNFIDLTLPSLQHFDRFLGWMVGRILFSSWLFSLWAIKTTAKVAITLVEQTERATHQILKYYEQLPHMGTIAPSVVDTTATIVNSEPEGIITNLVDAIEGKHLIIVGDTGTGKSMIAQYLAYQVGGEVKVYDPDAAPEEWTGLNVVGRMGNFEAIDESMQQDLDELERRVKVRGEKGDRALAGLDSVIIAEEFPLLRDEVETASTWFVKHAQRGRKPKRFIIALSQDDTVKSFGIEGEGGVRKCFKFLRLGKFAVTHARSLKDANIEAWLKSGKYRCMLEDYPCQLPDLSSFKMVTPRLYPNHVLQPEKTAETTTESGFEEILTEIPDDEKALSRAVKACIQAGLSDSKIIKDILGYSGAKYQAGKQLLEQLRG